VHWANCMLAIWMMLGPSMTYAAEETSLIDQGGMAALFLKSMTGLALVLALFAFLVWLARRIKLPMIPSVSNGPLHLVQRVAVGGRHSVVVLEYEGQRWLVGISPQNMAVLGKLEHSISRSDQNP